jgi:hypothetical protein
VEITPWAGSEADSCSQAPGDRLACFRRPLGLANQPKMTYCGHIDPSVSIWALAAKADGSMRAAAGIALSYSALMLTEAILAVMVK